MVEQEEPVAQPKDQPTHAARIHRLPPELLGMIFTICAQEWWPMPWSIQAPLVLCQVCSSWRKITLHSPMMWSRIIMQSERDRRLTPSLVAHCWLPRSRGVPLTVFLRCAGDDEPAPGVSLRYLELPWAKLQRPAYAVQRLAEDVEMPPSCIGIQHLRIDFDSHANFSPIPPITLPNLRQLKLYDNAGEYHWTKHWTFIIQSMTVPLLEHLSLTGVPSMLNVSCLTSFFGRSRCALRVLDVEATGDMVLCEDNIAVLPISSRASYALPIARACFLSCRDCVFVPPTLMESHFMP